MNGAARDTSPRPADLPRKWSAAALRVAMLRRLKRHLFISRILIRERQVVSAPLQGDDLDDSVTIRAATPADLAQATADLPGQLDPGFVAAALARDDVCLAAFHAGRMIAFVWRSFGTAPHTDSVWVQVDAPYWYTYKMYTLPDFRGQRLSGLLTLHGDTVCWDRGRVRGVGFIEVGNAASLRANLRLGSRVVGYAGYVSLFGRVFPFRTPGVVASTFRFCRHDV